MIAGDNKIFNAGDLPPHFIFDVTTQLYVPESASEQRFQTVLFARAIGGQPSGVVPRLSLAGHYYDTLADAPLRITLAKLEGGVSGPLVTGTVAAEKPRKRAHRLR